MAALDRILVTGANGFVGRHLMAELAASFPNSCVIGASGPAGLNSSFDVRDPQAVSTLVADATPDAVVHLAGTAAVAIANANPLATFAVNAEGTRNMLDATLRLAPNALFLLVSSSEVYGESLSSGLPTPETSPCAPLSPYARSKWEAEGAARAAAAKGLHVLIARPFNHTGPGQSTDFVVPAFAAQIAAIETGLQSPTIRVGWLDDLRDFTDVRDIVTGYAALLRQGRDIPSATAINLASGQAVAISRVLDVLRGLSRVRTRIEVDPAKLRPGRLPAMVGDPGLALQMLSWKSRIPLERTCAHVLQTFRSQFQLQTYRH